MLSKVTHCIGHVLANIPGLISCTGLTWRWGLLPPAQKCSQVAGLVWKVGRSSLKASSLRPWISQSFPICLCILQKLQPGEKLRYIMCSIVWCGIIVCVQISRRCIRGLLVHRLVVLMTHQVQFALQADKILALKDVSCMHSRTHVTSHDINKPHNTLLWCARTCQHATGIDELVLLLTDSTL